MLLVILALVITTVLFIVSFYKRRFSYWSSRGIPGPSPKFMIGNFIEVSSNKKPISLVLKKWTEEFGKVFGFYEGVRKIMVTSDMDMIQELFVKKFDNFYGRKVYFLVGDVDKEPQTHVFNARGLRWKRLRTLATPAFSTANLKKIRPTVEDSTLELVKLLEKHADGDAINILEFYQEYTIDVICRVAMGQRESTQFHNEYTKSVLGMFNRNFLNPLDMTALSMPFMVQPIRKCLLFIGQFTGNPFVKLTQQVTKAVEERMREREQGDTSSTIDFIDLFLDAQVDETVEDGDDVFSKGNVKISRTLTKEEIVAQCFVFLLAGFDTTANSLSYVSYLIAKHREVMKKVQEEIDEYCTDEDIPYDVLGKLKYMDNVVREGLRMYPLAAFANSRECMAATTLGDVPVEKGTLVMADTWSIHYSKEIWGEDADQFVPERWENSSDRPLLSWFPFGAGPRQCIGMRLAYMEEKLALAHILRRFDIVEGPKTEESLTLVGCMTTSPESVHVYLKKRDIDM